MIIKRSLSRAGHGLSNSQLFRWFYEKHDLIILILEKDKYIETAVPENVQYNNHEDILKFDECETWHNKREIEKEFMSRLEVGEISATLCHDGMLACYAWLNPNQKSAFFPLVQQEYLFPESCGALYNVYTHLNFRGRGMYKQVLNGIIQWTYLNTDLKCILTAIESNNVIALRANRAMGFKEVTQLKYKRIVGIVSK